MPHQCVRCNTFYDDGSSAILKGCSCGGKLFFFIKKEKLKQPEGPASPLSEKEKKEIESDIFKIIGLEEPEKPVVLDLESINVLKPGKYELDLVRLFKNEPLIFKVADGKYIIDIAATFERMRKKGSDS
ncbi:MAG: Zn-ribbon containing protein [Candidatus Woesearchaeota archaeon]